MFSFNLFQKIFPPRYAFMMIDHRSDAILLTQMYYTKIKALDCLMWHNKLTHQFKYRLVDLKNNTEITL